MGEKGYRSASSGAVSIGCCDMTVKCRCRWRWDHPVLCPYCRDQLHNPSCFLSSTLVFSLCSIMLFAALGMLYAWLTISPFKHTLFDSSELPCQEDNEGSWSIGIYFGDSPFYLQPIEQRNIWSDKGHAWPVANPILTCASVTDAHHPSNFVADPFLHVQGSKMYIFFESKNALTGQGDIGVAESSDGGISWKYLGIALDEEWHLSYPYVFEYNGQVYLMPEGSEKGDLRLYRALNFPLEWALERVLIKRPLVDASMVEYNEYFWIFGSDPHRFGTWKNGQLEIWYSSTPFGPWKQHSKNPAYNGPLGSGARNGGRLFTHEGKLYRVGQDCAETYVNRVRLFHVDTLSKDEFHEVEVSLDLGELQKGRNAWNGVRYHHLDVQRSPMGGWIAVMDGDRVKPGDLTQRYLQGVAAFLILILLIVLFGMNFGVIQCVFPLSKCLSTGKRSDMSSGWVRPQVTSRVHRVFSKLHRSSTAIRGCIKFSSCAGASMILICFFLSVLSLCIAVTAFFGGKGGNEPYPVEGQFSQFTMVTMTYEARLWNLRMYIKHYSHCASVREIVVIWNKGTPPNPETDFDSAVPVRIRVEDKNSLNNRFKIDPEIKTRAVFELDDDIMMPCDDLERAFKAWRHHPERIVGFYPRLSDGNPLKYRNERYARNQKGYNMILTGAAFLDSEAAFSKYWSPNAEAGRSLVDKLFNCEDILLNYILANSTAQRTVEYIHPTWAIDTSKLSSAAISRNTKLHYMKRTTCLSKFSELYGSPPLKKWDFGSRGDGWDY